MRDDLPIRATQRHIVALLCGLTLACLPVMLDLECIARAAALAEGSNDIKLLFGGGLDVGPMIVRVPLVLTSALVCVMAPGLLLVLALDTAPSLGAWLSRALLVGIVLVSVAAHGISTLAGVDVTGRSFAWLLLGLAAPSAVVLLWRARRGSGPRWPLRARVHRTTLVLVVAAPAVLATILLPKLLWESFNGDGAHTFWISRLLLDQALPFFPPEAGSVANFPGVSSLLFAYPSSWFIRLFGDLEVAARLPFLLYVPILFAVILMLAEQGRRHALPVVEQVVVWAGLAGYVLAMAFSASYSPYGADIALPATQDTLLMVCVLGAMAAVAAAERVWAFLFGLAACLCLPSGLLLIGLFGIGIAVFVKPRPVRSLAALAAGAATFAVLSMAAPTMLELAGYPHPGGEYSAEGLFSRFRFVQVADVRRVAFVLVPCGFVPLLAAAWLRWHDGVGRAIVLVVAFYFAMFYVQGYVSLHHFAPAMILPVVVFVRAAAPWEGRMRGWAIGGALLGGVIAIGLSLPDSTTLSLRPRQIGACFEDRIREHGSDRVASLARTPVLRNVVPGPWQEGVPETHFGVSTLALAYYVYSGPRSDPAYALQLIDDPEPAGARLLGAFDGAAVYALDANVWQEHRRPPEPRPAGAALYHIAADRQFRTGNPRHGPRIYDVRRLAQRLAGALGLGGGDE